MGYGIFSFYLGHTHLRMTSSIFLPGGGGVHKTFWRVLLVWVLFLRHLHPHPSRPLKISLFIDHNPRYPSIKKTIVKRLCNVRDHPSFHPPPPSKKQEDEEKKRRRKEEDQREGYTTAMKKRTAACKKKRRRTDFQEIVQNTDEKDRSERMHEKG